MRNVSFLILTILAYNCVIAQSAGDSVKSDILLRTYIESDNVPLNREVIYHVELRWQGELSKYQISDVVEPTLTNLSTRGSGSSNKVNTAADGTIYSIKRITFYLIPLEIGMAYVDGVMLKYTEQSTGLEESLISSRIGVKIIDPIPEPGESNLLSIILSLLTALIIIGASIYFFLQYQRRKEAEKNRAAMEIRETIEQKYLRLLKETIQFDTDNVKEGIFDLSHLLTGYFSEKFDFPAGNISTNHLLEILSEKNLDEDNFNRSKEFYARADMVKFAGEKVDSSEFHRLYDTVELVIENQAKRSIDES